MKLALSTRPPARDTLIVFVQDKKPLLGGHKELAAFVSAQIKKTEYSGDYAQTLVFPTFGKIHAENIILAGLGETKHYRMEYLERAASAAVRAGKKEGVKTFSTVTAAELSGVSEPAFVRAVARGATWGTYRFDTFKTGGKKPKSKPTLTFAGTCKHAAISRQALNEACLEGQALISTADLANLPGNKATPQTIANWAKKMAKENGLAYSELNKIQLKNKGCNAILAVAAGSAQDAKIITLKYKGTNPKAQPVLLVGKTITFDSGGLSLKTGKHMEWMQYDKSGGMAVLAAMQMIAQLKPATSVIGMLAAAENMPGGNAARPGDIVTACNGKTIEILNKIQLKNKGCNAILAVAAGSAQDAKIITLKYKGTNPKAQPLILVGKTITFDSGGLSLKTGKHMEWMQYDKSGGMAVLAAMQMVAQLKPATSVIGMLAAAENMPGGNAARPGDIVTACNGKTIEILNTDAEGRLVLADALSLAQQHKPAAIVDLATLTGAVVTALGHTAAAIVGNNPPFNQTLIEAGHAAGERYWELPLWTEHMDDVKGTFADLRNISKSSTAGTITGAAFLANFVPETVPWAHLDIAGTAYEESNKPWTDAGATLFGARTLIQWIKGIK